MDNSISPRFGIVRANGTSSGDADLRHRHQVYENERGCMKINDLRELLNDKRVKEEINKHLWIESQKAGHSIGMERAAEEWLRMYGVEWMKYNMPERFTKSGSRRARKAR
jgi:hypothetical protein